MFMFMFMIIVRLILALLLLSPLALMVSTMLYALGDYEEQASRCRQNDSRDRISDPAERRNRR